jgi:hypothetical protein
MASLHVTAHDSWDLSHLLPIAVAIVYLTHTGMWACARELAEVSLGRSKWPGFYLREVRRRIRCGTLKIANLRLPTWKVSTRVAGNSRLCGLISLHGPVSIFSPRHVGRPRTTAVPFASGRHFFVFLATSRPYFLTGLRRSGGCFASFPMSASAAPDDSRSAPTFRAVSRNRLDWALSSGLGRFLEAVTISRPCDAISEQRAPAPVFPNPSGWPGFQCQTPSHPWLCGRKGRSHNRGRRRVR